MADAPDDPVTIAEIRKNAREHIIIKLDEFKGSAIVHAWTFYQSTDGRLKAGRNGLAVAIHHLPALADAFQLALAKAIETGRLPPVG
jgi:hypothetical protein